MAKHFNYTRELLQEAVDQSVSIAGVIRYLGLHYSSGRHTTVKTKLAAFGIDIEHFTGQGSNRGPDRRGGPKQKLWKEVLILRRKDQAREAAFRLRRALIESGRPYACEAEGCTVKGEWNGMELRLRVDHISGDWHDCRPGNVQFLCPNCHAQTETWGKNNGGTSVTSNAESFRQRRRKRRSRSEPK